jgi:hypothetical protein
VRISSAVEATRLIDPWFADTASARLLRVVLDQARAHPMFNHLDVPRPTGPALERLRNLHRVGPLVERRWPTDTGQEWHRQLTVGQLQLVAVSKAVIATLAAKSIDVRLLKGLATGPLDYPAASLRHTGDVDLLVRRRDLGAAIEAMVAAGCHRHGGDAIRPELHTGSTLLHPSGEEIDVHFRLSRYHRAADHVCLMEHPVTLAHGGLALPAELRLMHAAAHSLLTPHPNRRLSSMADITAIIDNTGVDWSRTRGLADLLGLTGIAAVAMRAEALIVDRSYHPGLSWPTPGMLMKEAFVASKRRLPLQHLLAISALPPDVARRDYVKAWLTPPHDALEFHGGKRAYYRRLYGRLRGGR